MSYILKALKKSEAERAKGTVPRLTPQQAPAPRTRSALWSWILGAALAVNATVVGFAAWGPEIQLLKGGDGQDGDAPSVAAPTPIGDGAAVTAPAPKASANGSAPLDPAALQTAAKRQAPEPQDQLAAVPAAQLQGSQQGLPAQAKAPEQRAAASPQTQQPRSAARPQAPPGQSAVRPQTFQQQPTEQRRAQQPRPPLLAEAPEERAAAPPQTRKPRPAAQPQTRLPEVAVPKQARPAAPTGQDTQTQTAAAGRKAADRAGGTTTSRTADRSPPLAVPAESAERAAAGAATPKPARKPREALGRSARRPVLGDPLPLDGDLRASRPGGSDLALVAPEPAPPKAEEPRISEPDPYAEVPMLWQLPSVIRSTLPKLTVSVHVYSPEAAGRFVIVERNKYREGDVLAGGAKLEAILADGIVVDYQGRRYRIGN